MTASVASGFLSGAILRVFALQRRLAATMAVKFGAEYRSLMGTDAPSLSMTFGDLQCLSPVGSLSISNSLLVQ